MLYCSYDNYFDECGVGTAKEDLIIVNDELFDKISLQVESEMGYGGLSSTMYEVYARECLNQYLRQANMPVVEDTDYFDDSPIHKWFELSYANYLTIPRTALQSMPNEWQAKFVALLNELDDTLDWRPSEGCYYVQLRDGRGRYMADPLADYQRGRVRIDGKKELDNE